MTMRGSGMLLAASWLTSCTQPIVSTYPQTLTAIPAEFRGGWDEIIDDGCADREPRFLLSDKTLGNFEINYDVLRVVRSSPVDIEVYAQLDPVFGEPEQSIWMFKLVESGDALAARDGEPPFYKRCPKLK